MMNRRRFVASLLGTSLAAPLFRPRQWDSATSVSSSERSLALPTPEQNAWQDLEIGMMVHIAPNTWQDREYDDLSTPLSAINPEINTDQWADCAVGLGAKYVVFVAKHAGGFCMWQTDTTSYSIRNTPWRGGHGDVIADLARSCRKYGLKLGVYLSPQDDKFGAATGGRCKTAEQQAAYDELYRRQLREVLSRYGEMVEIWFDGSIIVPVADILKELAPHSMVFNGPQATIRWVGNEDGFAPYPAWNSIRKSDAETGVATAMLGDPNGSVWMPNEVDVSIRRPNWFWSTTNDANLVSLDQLLEIYYRSVGHGTQLLLNIPADRHGLMPDPDRTRAREFGDEVRRRFGHAVAETSGSGETLILSLPKPSRIDHVILQENCSLGERVRAYKLEGRSEGKWRVLGTGSAIGHKRIQPIEPVAVDAVRLIAVESAALPAIRRLAVFNVGSAPPRTWNAPAHITADNLVGEWVNFRFEIDLSAKILSAGQYRLRFVPQGGSPITIENPILLLGGVSEPHLLRTEPQTGDSLILTIPGIGQKVFVKGRVQGVERGTLLLQKL